MKTRYRVQTRLFQRPLIVLQIGEDVRVPKRITPFGWKGEETVTNWRDATMEDLTRDESCRQPLKGASEPPPPPKPPIPPQVRRIKEGEYPK